MNVPNGYNMQVCTLCVLHLLQTAVQAEKASFLSFGERGCTVLRSAAAQIEAAMFLVTQ